MRTMVPLTLPSRWPSVAAKWVLRRVERPPAANDGIITAFRDGQVTLRTNRRMEGFTNAVQEFGYQGIRRGDLVIHGMDAFAGTVGVSDSDGKASPVVHAYVSRGEADVRYYSYFLRVLAWSGFIVSLARGIRERSTAFDASTFQSLVIPAPSLAEQRVIADYLDVESSRIDTLIAKKRRMVELLEERRAVFVAHAVSHGLRSNAEVGTMNPYAPAIPQGWRLMRLKHALERLVDTAHKTAPEVSDGKYLVVRTANIKNGQLVLDDAKHTSEAGFREWTERGIPRPGDVLLTREAPAGEACLVPEGLPLCIGQRVVWLKLPVVPIVSGEFLLYSLYGGPGQEFMKQLSRSTTVAHLNMADIPSIPVAVPPVSDQASIVVGIRREAERIDRLTAQLGRQVELLNERRQALITAAVTGEMDLPGVAA